MPIFLFLLGVGILFLLLLRHLPEVAEESAAETRKGLLEALSGFEKKVESGIVHFAGKILQRRTARPVSLPQPAEKQTENSGKKFSFKFLLPKFGAKKESSFDYATLAENAFEARQYSVAEKYLIQAIAKNPGDPKLFNKLGIIYLELKNYEDAKNAFAEATKLDPGNAFAWNNYGLAHFNLGNNLAAIEAYEKSLAIDNTIASRHANLGMALLAEKQHAAAEAAFEKAKSLDFEGNDYDRLIREAQKSREKLVKVLGRETL